MHLQFLCTQPISTRKQHTYCILSYICPQVKRNTVWPNKQTSQANSNNSTHHNDNWTGYLLECPALHRSVSSITKPAGTCDIVTCHMACKHTALHTGSALEEEGREAEQSWLPVNFHLSKAIDCVTLSGEAGLLDHTAVIHHSHDPQNHSSLHHRSTRRAEIRYALSKHAGNGQCSKQYGFQLRHTLIG